MKLCSRLLTIAVSLPNVLPVPISLLPVGCGKSQPPANERKASASNVRPDQRTPDQPGDGGAAKTAGKAPAWRLRWPAGVRVVRAVTAPVGELPGFSRRLGGEIRSVRHYDVSQGSAPLRVNVIEADTVKSARAIEKRLRAMPGGVARIARKGRVVIETVCRDLARCHGLMRSLGLLDRAPRRYLINVRLGLLEKGDAAAATALLNLAHQARPDDPGWRAAWKKHRTGMTFGRVLRLSGRATPVGRPRYQFAPTPTSDHAAGPSRIYTFAEAPTFHRIPYVDVTAEVPTQGWTDLFASRPPPTLREATPAWPKDHPTLRQLLKEIAPKGQAMERLRALHGWVNKHIRYGGPRGSRLGTLAVLKGRQGQCWDMADLLITLARAAGLPARQVAGWTVGQGGHIWAEVWIAQRGWISVDPTVPWLGVPGEYLPLMITEDGVMPVLHLRIPRIRRLK